MKPKKLIEWLVQYRDTNISTLTDEHVNIDNINIENLPDFSMNEPAELLRENEIKDEIEYSFLNLSVREENVIRLRFGFDLEKGRTLEEIGKPCGVTRDRILQIEKRGLEKLRDQFTDKYNDLSEII